MTQVVLSRSTTFDSFFATIGALVVSAVVLALYPAVAAGEEGKGGGIGDGETVAAEQQAEQQVVSDLTASKVQATTIALDWEASSSPPESTIKGYNIYQRKQGLRFAPQPDGFTGVRDEDDGTRYVADRLEPGETYEFKVVARNADLEEVGEEKEITVTTEDERGDTYRYMTLKVAVMVYKNANHRNGGDHKTSDQVFEDYKLFLDKAKDFLWRNTDMRLNVDFTYYPIDEHVTMEDRTFQSVNVTGRHLQEMFGVMNTQYDMIFRLTPSVGGFWSVGATDRIDEVISGPDRRTGFSHLQLPLRERGYGGDPFESRDQVNEKVITNLIWLFIHEGQHAFDGIYRWNAHPEFGHGDRPERYGNQEDYSQTDGPDSLRFGKRYDYQATLFRTFDPEDSDVYLDLDEDWGVVREVKDEDGDDFPDADPRVALNEQDFGSDVTSADTDGDGLDDKAEATNGIYPYSAADPNNSDTDGDGKNDGQDRHPRYDASNTILNAGGFRPAVDGDVGEWPQKTEISRGVFHKTRDVGSFDPTVHAVHTPDSLYVALELPRSAVPMMRFDFDADGRWFGAGNTEIVTDVVDEGIERLRTYDASVKVRNSLSNDGIWDTSSEYQEEFGRIYRTTDVRFGVRRTSDGQVGIEMGFPKREDDDITFETGQDIGFRLDYMGIGDPERALSSLSKRSHFPPSEGETKTELNGLAEYPTPEQTRGFGARLASTSTVDGPAQAETFDKWSYVYFTLSEEKVEEGEQAQETALEGGRPNPFRESTTIPFRMKEKEQVRIVVYDVLGRHVETLLNREVESGKNKTTWSGAEASGVYFIRLETASGKEEVKKVVKLN